VAGLEAVLEGLLLLKVGSLLTDCSLLGSKLVGDCVVARVGKVGAYDGKFVGIAVSLLTFSEGPSGVEIEVVGMKDGKGTFVEDGIFVAAAEEENNMDCGTFVGLKLSSKDVGDNVTSLCFDVAG